MTRIRADNKNSEEERQEDLGQENHLSAGKHEPQRARRAQRLSKRPTRFAQEAPRPPGPRASEKLEVGRRKRRFFSGLRKAFTNSFFFV